MLVDWKCTITMAILTVLIYLLLQNILERVWGPSVGKEGVDWYKSIEALLFYTGLIAYNVNQQLFASCRM
jgi:hypothetical protein